MREALHYCGPHRYRCVSGRDPEVIFLVVSNVIGVPFAARASIEAAIFDARLRAAILTIADGWRRRRQRKAFLGESQ
jgi:hypothetical protein